MATKPKKCNRCGCKIDPDKDLDCVALKMFQIKNITNIQPDPSYNIKRDTGYHRVDAATKLHLCGRCMSALMSHYVYGSEYKKLPISENIVLCGDCKHHLLSSCPLCYIEKKTLQFVEMRSDFFCGYGERKDDNND